MYSQLFGVCVCVVICCASCLCSCVLCVRVCVCVCCVCVLCVFWFCRAYLCFVVLVGGGGLDFGEEVEFCPEFGKGKREMSVGINRKMI